ncbi:hypothetical protein EJ06DRAFT_522648 [Trichodelitschia bisporula]|uniref:Uncharacterized protein n=1 Tax=Trichodelitschia bisporula TaxID=703511 RepID=A0A6G1HTN1_9PEZI|nr:hypothetical protein EJ06DRAFT_522648 [Trichodelitschia bisporula]
MGNCSDSDLASCFPPSPSHREDTPFLLPKIQRDALVQGLMEPVEEHWLVHITNDNVMDSEVVYILDEAQMTYSNQEFWLSSPKPRTEGCKDPGSGSEPIDGATLSYISSTQRVSLQPSSHPGGPSIGLFFTREEFDELWVLCRSRFRCEFTMDWECANYVYDLTLGHPGTTVGILCIVVKVMRRQIIEDEEAFFRHLATWADVMRSFPARRIFPEIKSVMSSALVDGHGNFDRSIPEQVLCYRKGYLHAEATDLFGEEQILVFPSPLHRNPPPFPSDKFPLIRELAIAAIIRLPR